MANTVKDIEISQKDALIIALQKQNEEQQKLIEEQQKQISEQSRLIEELRFQLDQFRKLVYGAKRERYVSQNNPDQGKLFNDEAEATEAEVVEQVEVKPNSAAKSKKKQKLVKRNKFPSHLEREVQEIYPEGLDAQTAKVIGKDVTEILVCQQAMFKVKQTVRYRCKVEDDQGQVSIKQVPVEPRIIPKGMVDESVLAHLINEKIQHHTPLYRQTKKFRQMGLDFIKTTTIDGWYSKGLDALMPLYHLFVDEVMSQNYLQVDESSIKVIKNNKVGSTHRGYMWVAHSPSSKAVLFHYDSSRSQTSADQFLASFNGNYLQCDGYAVYDNVAADKQIHQVFCAAHSRRKFKEALDKKEHPKLCEQALWFYQQLYDLERQFREKKLTYEQRQEQRIEKSLPILEQFKEWLDKQCNNMAILPNDRLAKAITYTRKRWTGLIAYCYNGALEIDNNLVENTIRPLALGRKNYLFAGSEHGAYQLAIGYSFVNTCLKNNINPEKYLTWVSKKIANNKVDDKAINWLPHRLDKDTAEKLKI